MMVESVEQEKQGKNGTGAGSKWRRGISYVAHTNGTRHERCPNTAESKIREVLYEPHMLCLAEQPGASTPIHKKVNNGTHQKE